MYTVAKLTLPDIASAFSLLLTVPVLKYLFIHQMVVWFSSSSHNMLIYDK